MSPASPAATAVPADPPAGLGAAPPRTGKRRGNPGLGLAHISGGCPCRAPAIRGKLRCPAGQPPGQAPGGMAYRGQAPHGGRSTGPRTAEAMARLHAARTVHGAYSAEALAFNRWSLSSLRRGLVWNSAMRCRDLLPPELAARPVPVPPELMPPCQGEDLAPAENRAVVCAEAPALAPWREAIAQTWLAGRARRAPHRGPRPGATGGREGTCAEPHAPVLPHRAPAAAPDAADAVQPGGTAKAHAPERAGVTSDTALAASLAAPVATHAEAYAPVRFPLRLGVARLRATAGQNSMHLYGVCLHERAGQDPMHLYGPCILAARPPACTSEPVKTPRTCTASACARWPVRTLCTCTMPAAPRSRRCVRTGLSKAHAPDRAADGRGVVPTAAPAGHGGLMHPQPKAHAPDRAADGRGAVPGVAAAVTHGGDAPKTDSAQDHRLCSPA